MIEVGELLDFIISAILTVYLVFLVVRDCSNMHSFWFLGLLSLLLSKLLSILEGLFLYNIMNYSEHLFFLIASVCIVVSIYKKELS